MPSHIQAGQVHPGHGQGYIVRTESAGTTYEYRLEITETRETEDGEVTEEGTVTCVYRRKDEGDGWVEQTTTDVTETVRDYMAEFGYGVAG